VTRLLRPSEVIAAEDERCNYTRVIVGMPHLSLGGLSENWLLKECGHIHWQMLARYFQLESPDFRDRFGNRLYAAFVAIELRDASLEMIREHDGLEIGSDIKRLSRSQFVSIHGVACEGMPCATVEMISVFLRRSASKNNHSVIRASIPCDENRNDGSKIHPLIKESRALRNNTIARDASAFKLVSPNPDHKFQFKPCPHGDFNGAQFLYFAAHQAIIDRAEWHWELSKCEIAQTSSRRIFYYGNVNVSEALEVRCCGLRETNAGFIHWCEIVRQSDNMRIADAFTHRHFAT
jgi:probable biosynthetic protein (TIGR04099 family)